MINLTDLWIIDKRFSSLMAVIMPILTLAFSPPSDASETQQDCPHCPEMVHIVNTATSMGRHEITRDQYAAFIKATNYPVKGGCMYYDVEGDWGMGESHNWQNPGFPQTGSHPVACVSWSEAVAYTRWLSETTSNSYRLPTPDEWEAAARSGTSTLRPWGDSSADACTNANTFDTTAHNALNIKSPHYPCQDQIVFTATVGSFNANSNGLTDMIGNVFEWTSDCDPSKTGSNCGKQEVRGGCWYSGPELSTVSYRYSFDRDFHGSGIGFRVVRDD